VLVWAAEEGATISDVPDTPFNLHHNRRIELIFHVCFTQGENQGVPLSLSMLVMLSNAVFYAATTVTAVQCAGALGVDLLTLYSVDVASSSLQQYSNSTLHCTRPFDSGN